MLVVSYINCFIFVFKEEMSMGAYYEEKPYVRLYSRVEIEERPTVCSKCKDCTDCENFELIQFEFDRNVCGLQGRY